MRVLSLVSDYFKTFRSRRWAAAWVQALLIIGAPFLKIEGQSALRFDVPSLKLYFFGSVLWISEAYFFLLVFLLFLVGVMVFTVLYGRVWCGWMCPQTVLSDFSRRIERIASWFGIHGILRRILSQIILVLFSLFAAAGLLWYFVSPYDMASDIMKLDMGPWTFWSWMFFTGLVYVDIVFVRQKFCGSVCPYARFQSAFFDESTLTIAFDESRAAECLGCEACVKTCPSGIDIRQGLQIECINCAECIDSCRAMTRAQTKAPLVRYRKGDAEKKGPRTRAIGLAVAFAVIAALFAYQVYVRMPLDFWIFRDEPQPLEQVGGNGSMINVYSLIVENRSLEPHLYELRVSGVREADLRISQNPFILPPNTTAKMKISVTVQRKNLTLRITPLRFVIRDVAAPEIRLEQQALFIYPDRTEKGWEI